MGLMGFVGFVGRFDTVSFQQGIDGGLTATEALVERHGVLGTTLGEHLVAEALGAHL